MRIRYTPLYDTNNVIKVENSTSLLLIQRGTKTGPLHLTANIQWRNSGLKSEEDQAKFLTWCTYKVGVRAPTPKK